MRAIQLRGAQLDAWVARSAGLTRCSSDATGFTADCFEQRTWHPDSFHPSSDWTQGGRLVANEWYDIEDCLFNWFGPGWASVEAVVQQPLVWFMRAFVAANFGDEVEEGESKETVSRGNIVAWASNGIRRLRLATGQALRRFA